MEERRDARRGDEDELDHDGSAVALLQSTPRSTTFQMPAATSTP
jgi:hypothetical protein